MKLCKTTKPKDIEQPFIEYLKGSKFYEILARKASDS
jgi:hypothetical protein